MAHPDDAELWAGGTIARHIRHGGTTTIAVVHHDDIRDAEAATGAHVLGAHLKILDELTPATVSALLTQQRPDVCDSYNDLDMTGRPYDLPVILDITDTWETKIAALRVHTSQPILDHFGPMADTLARLHGGRIGVTRAEAFRALPVLGILPAHRYL